MSEQRGQKTRREVIAEALMGAEDTMPDGLSPMQQIEYLAEEVDNLLGLHEGQPTPPIWIRREDSK